MNAPDWLTRYYVVELAAALLAWAVGRILLGADALGDWWQERQRFNAALRAEQEDPLDDSHPRR